MKQFTLKSLMLLLLLLIGGGSYAWGETWIRCTSVSDLISGGTFILGYEATANSGIIVPMQCSGTATATTAGYLNGGTEKTTGKNTVDMSNVTETSKYEVTIGASSIADGAVSIKCGDYFVGNNDEKNKLKLFSTETENTAFTPSVGKNDVFTLTLAACKTYNKLRYNPTNPRFACYKDSQKDVVIYKKNGDGDTPSLNVNTTSVDFGTVEQNAAVEAKTVSVSLKNVTSANVKLTGEGASAFEVSPAVLTASDKVTITPKTTTVGTYTAKLEISADGVESQSVDVRMTVEKPFDGGVWEIKGADLGSAGSYETYKGEHGPVHGFAFYIENVMKSTAKGHVGEIQFRKNTGFLYNTTSFSNIVKIELETSNTFTVYVGNAVQPETETQKVEGISANGVVTYNIPEGNGYFTIIKNADDETGYISSIKVYYSTSPSEPTYTANTLTFKASNKEGHWATFSNDDVTFFPNDVTVNTVVVENNGLELLAGEDGVFGDLATVNVEGKEVKGYYIPAKTGVLVYSADETVTYYVVKNKEVAPVDGDFNMLKPASEKMTEGFKYYKLAYDNFTEKTGLGFYWGAAEGGAFTVKPGLAYLAVSQAQAANVKGFSFDGTQTGINGVEATAAKGAIYDLNGQRVEKAQRGIYIQNGKKFIVK